MNRTDAAVILNIDPSASPEEARRAYQELFTEHQVRLTNAPTPALRSLYQARLLELDEAKDALLAPSLNDANSDLPTDQPSIPSSGRNLDPPKRPPASPPPPPRVEQEERDRKFNAPPPAPAEKPKTAAAEKPSSFKKKAAVGAAAVLLGVIVLVVLPNFLNRRARQQAENPGESQVQRPPNTTSLADSLPVFRESITIARVEFERGDYDAAKRALADADAFYAKINPDEAPNDTAVVHLKTQLDQLRSKVTRACEALKKVAERHPGEPTCKSS